MKHALMFAPAVAATLAVDGRVPALATPEAVVSIPTPHNAAIST